MYPWDNEKWVPGVLSNVQIASLQSSRFLEGAQFIGESSLDICIDNSGYELRKGTIKPFGDTYARILTDNDLCKQLTPETNVDGKAVFTLEPKHSYLFRVKERLRLPKSSNIYGEATPKSSIGRVDVIVRLIVDRASEYDEINSEELNSNEQLLFLEVTPITFPVKVKEGEPLTQLRLFYGKPDNCKVQGTLIYQKTMFCPDGKENDGILTVNLEPETIGGIEVSAFEASSSDAQDPICLWKVPNNIIPDPCKYWKFRNWDRDRRRLTISTDRFYILRSKELLNIPDGVAVYCRAMDEKLGEMRIHYAGFVHPHFGANREDGAPGAPLIFEVRGHNIDVSLCDNEKLARLDFYRMSRDYVPTDVKKATSYSNQKLQLSNLFGKWPDKLELGEDGTVTPIEGK